MDSFEQVVATILDRAGYWVRTSVKVNLIREDKHAMAARRLRGGSLDVVAYGGRDNELLVVECNSISTPVGGVV